MAEPHDKVGSALKDGDQCPACYKVVRFPLSHVCNAKDVNAHIVNDVGDYVVFFGEEKHRFPRAVFLQMIRQSARSAGGTSCADIIGCRQGQPCLQVREAIDQAVRVLAGFYGTGPHSLDHKIYREQLERIATLAGSTHSAIPTSSGGDHG